MWILVVVAGFLITGVYFYITLYSPRWRGRPWYQPSHLPSQTKAFCKQFTLKRQATVHGGFIRLGIDCPERFDFAIGKEGWLERFSKALGLSREFEVGDQSFDEKIYVGSDDLYFIRLLTRSAAVRSAIQSLFAEYRLTERRVKNIHCHGGRLWLDLRIDNSGEGEGLRAMLEVDARNLWVLREALMTAPVKLAEPIAKRVRLRSTVLLVSNMALLGASLCLWLFYYLSSSHQLFLGDLLRQSLLLAILVWLGLLAIILALLIRTARFHVVMMQFLLLGTPGVFGVASSAYLHANIAHDDQEPVLRCADVRGLQIEGSRKRQTYLVGLSGWQLANGKYLSNITWYVDAEEYFSLAVGDQAHFYEHKGRLGMPWLDGLRRGCPLDRN